MLFLSGHRLLIQAGYDVNIKDYDGWTPLHAAAHWGKEEACRILVENLCDMDLINKMVSHHNSHQRRRQAHRNAYIYTSLTHPQGQTAFDVADEDVLGYLEELQKKQNLVSSRVSAQNNSVCCCPGDCIKVVQACDGLCAAFLFTAHEQQERR